MHFKVFYDNYYLSIETLKQEDIQVDLYSVGTTLLYVSYAFFTAFQQGSDLQIILSMYNLLQPVTTLSGKLQTQGSSTGHCHLLSVKNGLKEKSQKMKSCFFTQKMHFHFQCIWHESTKLLGTLFLEPPFLCGHPSQMKVQPFAGQSLRSSVILRS